MIASLTAVTAALLIGLPLLALGEHIRERGGADRHTSPTSKETTP